MPNKSTTVNEHYIPQFYLKNFSSDKKRLFQYQINSNAPSKLVSIESICYEKNLYEFRNNDGEIVNKNLIEDSFAIYENKISKVIKSIELKSRIEDNFHTPCFLSTEEKAFLIFFLATLILRKPEILNAAQEIAKESFGENITDNISYNLSLNYCLPIYRCINPKDKNILNSALKLFENMTFQILTTSKDCIFTSDNPVILFGENGFKKIKDVFFPLTPRNILHMRPYESTKMELRNRMIYIEGKQMKSINSLIILRCKRWLFSKNELTPHQIRRIEKIRKEQ